MIKIINASSLSNNLAVTSGIAFALALTLMVGFQYAHASEVNIVAGENLAEGSRGQSVAVLQGLMSELDFLQVPKGVSLGYYGPLTKAAVVRYQLSRNVVSDGYFGPATKIAMHQQFMAMNWLKLLNW